MLPDVRRNKFNATVLKKTWEKYEMQFYLLLYFTGIKI